MPSPFPTDEPPAACAPTLAAVQRVLDGAEPVTVLDAGAHAVGCAACRARVAEARVLLAALAVPPEAISVPSRFTNGVLSALKADRRDRRRRRLLMSVGGGLAVAAAVVLAVVMLNRQPDQPEVVERPPAVVPQTSEPQQAPAPRPVRVSVELAKAGDALRESSRPLAEAAAAPKALANIAEAILPPMAAPMTDDVAPVAASLAELPAAARTGLEPVTGTTQKAFDRFLRDVGVFQTSARPKS